MGVARRRDRNAEDAPTTRVQRVPGAQMRRRRGEETGDGECGGGPGSRWAGGGGRVFDKRASRSRAAAGREGCRLIGRAGASCGDVGAGRLLRCHGEGGRRVKRAAQLGRPPSLRPALPLHPAARPSRTQTSPIIVLLRLRDRRILRPESLRHGHAFLASCRGRATP